jgi:hypothetical protein
MAMNDEFAELPIKSVPKKRRAIKNWRACYKKNGGPELARHW